MDCDVTSRECTTTTTVLLHCGKKYPIKLPCFCFLEVRWLEEDALLFLPRLCWLFSSAVVALVAVAVEKVEKVVEEEEEEEEEEVVAAVVAVAVEEV